MNKRYYSYAGIHYEILKEEINKLILTLRFMGNENPILNYLGIYRVFKDSEGKYTITRNIDNVLFSKSPEEVDGNELELTIVKDLIKNPWAIAPPQFIQEVIETEHCIAFLTKQKYIANNEEDKLYFQKIIELLYGSLFDLGNQPDQIYNYGGAIYLHKSIAPNKWEYVQKIKNQIIAKEGYENWGQYIESYLFFPSNNSKLVIDKLKQDNIPLETMGIEEEEEEDEYTKFDYEVELLGKLFNIDIT